VTEPSAPLWDDADWPPLPALEGGVEADVCVVGLGGSGLAAVHELLSSGVRVAGVDAGSVGGGAAGRNGGFLLAGLPSFYHDAVRDLGRERARAIYRLTMAEIARMQAATPASIRETGSLRLADSVEEEADCAAQLAAMRRDGLPAEPYDGPEGRGLLVPTDGAFQPLARCRALARSALDAGALLFERSPAVEIEAGAVRTPVGRVRCTRVVVAVDGGLETLLPELRGRVRTSRLQMLGTAPASELVVPRPVYARWGLDYWQQLPDGRLALGGGRDVGGEAEWTDDSQPTDVVQRALDRILRERLGARAPVTHRWAAAVGYTATRMPVAEQVRPGVWATGAYSGTGNVLGALLGRAVAQAALRGESPLLAPFPAGGPA
jgi:glycine/D-amino acid oxidase-like deaminating enzyme